MVLRPHKREHTFAQGLHNYEVSEPSYPENFMREAIVWSLRSNGYESIRGLGPRASVHRIVETLKKIYESKTNPDLVMQEFYRMNQGSKETMMDFGTRLYSTLTKIRTNHPNLMSELESEKRLCDRFFYMSCHQDGGRSQGDTGHSMLLARRQGSFNFNE